VHLIAERRYVMFDEPAPASAVFHLLRPNSVYESTAIAGTVARPRG
jgi:hypothetical protein